MVDSQTANEQKVIFHFVLILLVINQKKVQVVGKAQKHTHTHTHIKGLHQVKKGPKTHHLYVQMLLNVSFKGNPMLAIVLELEGYFLTSSLFMKEHTGLIRVNYFTGFCLYSPVQS